MSLQLGDVAPGFEADKRQAGEDVIIVPSLSDEEARQKFPQGWRALKPYLRLVPQPKD